MRAVEQAVTHLIRCKISALLAIVVLSVSTLSIHSQQGEPAEPTREQLKTQISILLDQIKKLQTANAQPQPVDPELRKAYIEAKKKEYQYLAKIMDVNIQAFDAQWWSSYAILGLVIIVVLAGVSFSGFQLWKSVSVAGVQSSNELEISASKVRVTSSVVGIVVLTISLAFLYIYTVQVYQMHIIRVAEPTGQQNSTSVGK
jgi:hypothetical protein